MAAATTELIPRTDIEPARVRLEYAANKIAQAGNSLPAVKHDAHHIHCTGFMTVQPDECHIYPTCAPCDGRCREWA